MYNKNNKLEYIFENSKDLLIHFIITIFGITGLFASIPLTTSILVYFLFSLIIIISSIQDTMDICKIKNKLKILKYLNINEINNKIKIYEDTIKNINTKIHSNNINKLEIENILKSLSIFIQEKNT